MSLRLSDRWEALVSYYLFASKPYEKALLVFQREGYALAIVNRVGPRELWRL